MCNKQSQTSGLKHYFVHESIWAGLSVEDSVSAEVAQGCDPQLEAGISSLLTPVVDAGYWQDLPGFGCKHHSLYVAAWLPPPCCLAPSMDTPKKTKVEASFPKARSRRLVQHHFHSFLLVKKSQTKGRWISIPPVEECGSNILKQPHHECSVLSPGRKLGALQWHWGGRLAPQKSTCSLAGSQGDPV